MVASCQLNETTGSNSKLFEAAKCMLVWCLGRHVEGPGRCTAASFNTISWYDAIAIAISSVKVLSNLSWPH